MRVSDAPPRFPTGGLRRAGQAHGAGEADHVLLDRFARQRDEAAFTTLVARHGPLVLGAARRALGDATATEDVFQAFFLVLAQKASRERGVPSSERDRVTFSRSCCWCFSNNREVGDVEP